MQFIAFVSKLVYSLVNKFIRLCQIPDVISDSVIVDHILQKDVNNFLQIICFHVQKYGSIPRVKITFSNFEL